MKIREEKEALATIRARGEISTLIVLQSPSCQSSTHLIATLRLWEKPDKSSVEYQRLTWDALRKSINGLVHKVNASNIKNIRWHLLDSRTSLQLWSPLSTPSSPKLLNLFLPLIFLLFTSIVNTGIFERFRGILHEGDIDKRVQYLIEGLFAIRKAKFQVNIELK